MGWTDERVSLLRKLWTEGLSASQIAKQLGGVTRNAVIGKVHRLGLAGRATPSRPAKRPVRVARPRPAASPTAPRLRPPMAPGLPPVIIPHLEPLPLDNGQNVTVLTLTDRMCKFPIGDPTDADFAFCGRDSCNGPYCSDHARLAYQPSQTRRRRTDQPQEERPMRMSAM
ncbi:MAG: GcrA family cell cycle regulator [Caulobacterales bacterium]